MDYRTAIIMTNYNMPEACDRLVEHIIKNTVCDYNLFICDNGSDLQPPSKYTAVTLRENVQTTAGWLMGLHYADYFAEKYKIRFDTYTFVITSAIPVDGTDFISPCVEFLEQNPEAVGVHPALTEDSTTAWKHLITRGTGEVRQTFMIDNIASTYRANWFDEIGRFDPEMTYAWGIDLDTCIQARRQDRSLWIHEGCQIKKTTDIAYSMNRMNMSADQRRTLAYDNMKNVLSRKYGENWQWIARNENVREEWR